MGEIARKKRKKRRKKQRRKERDVGERAEGESSGKTAD